MTATEKVAYLRGLSEGLGIDDTSKEGRVIKAIIDVLDDLAISVSDMEDDIAELGDQVEAVDEDLEALEEEFYGDDEDDDEYDEDEDDFDDEELYEVTCPSCGDTICVNEEMLDEGSIHCPNCDELLEFDLECDCDDGSCDGSCDSSQE